MIRQYRHHVLREWIDITLAANERFGASFFSKSPPAYFVDNVRLAARGERTAPDWWLDIRKAEQEKVRSELFETVLPNLVSSSDDASLESDSKKSFEEIRNGVFDRMMAEGRPRGESIRAAERVARLQTQGGKTTASRGISRIRSIPFPITQKQ
jgi:hypothetical protein